MGTRWDEPRRARPVLDEPRERPDADKPPHPDDFDERDRPLVIVDLRELAIDQIVVRRHRAGTT